MSNALRPMITLIFYFRSSNSPNNFFNDIFSTFSSLVTGDTEFILSLKTYMQSVICTHVCHLYVVDVKNYERLVTRRNPKTVDWIREHVEMKLLSRVQRKQLEIKVPLFKTLLLKLQNISKPSTKMNDKKLYSDTMSESQFVPPRGALIDMFGPGTVFYRNRQRERAKNEAENKVNKFRGMYMIEVIN